MSTDANRLKETATRLRDNNYRLCRDSDVDQLHSDWKTLADAYLTGPAWQDKPTCEGVWMIHHANRTMLVVRYFPEDIGKPLDYIQRCYGPIPDDAGGGK